MNELASLLERIERMPAPQLPDVLAELERARAHIWLRMMRPDQPTEAPDKADDLLTPSEVSTRLGVDRRWVYRHRDELGGFHISRRKLRFHESKIRRYLTRKGSQKGP